MVLTRFQQVVFLTVGLLLLAACARAGRPRPTVTISAAASLEPTPTLVTGLSTRTIQPPTPPVFQASGAAPTATDSEPTSTVTPEKSPTATPLPEARLSFAENFSANENYQAAASEYEAALDSKALNAAQGAEARFGLGQAQYQLGRYAEAAKTLGELLASDLGSENNSFSGSGEQSVSDEHSRSFNEAHFILARALEAQDDCSSAITSYEAYLRSSPGMAAYVQPRIAACYLALGDRPAAIEAYELAADADSHRLTKVAIHQRLAQMYLENGDYPLAVAQYDAIFEMVQTERTRGQVTYQAGSAELLAGNDDAGYARYLSAVNDFPRANESYLALVALVEAGIEVDDFQRGLVDYYAEAYDPAIVAFMRYVEANPAHREDAHLYMAWSYEGLNDIDAALAQIDAYIEANTSQEFAGDDRAESGDPSAVARGWIERAELAERAGRYQIAVDSYLAYIDAFPDGEHAAMAAWQTASLAERMGDLSLATERYREMAESYPEHSDAAEALFRAGYLALRSGEPELASESWHQAIVTYMNHEYGAASLIWLLRMDPSLAAETPPISQDQIGEEYYRLRAIDIVSGTMPFMAPSALNLGHDASEQQVAEAWLRQWLQLDRDADVEALDPRLLEDGRLIRGEELWHLGLWEEAKNELEDLRQEYADDPLSSYQLAIFFRDLGLYRSSILAANSVVRNSGGTVFEVPRFVGKLVYPTYYADLITSEADQYGYDPLLQFALVRQESLFESFAASSAAARGLSQVIPDTGAYIAQRLGWPNYKTEDLYLPYVGIAFGAFYLAQQLDAFDGDVAAALSAYNAGPGNAARWYGEAKNDIDQYIELVDFAETRQYIERIYVGQAIYRYLYAD